MSAADPDLLPLELTDLAPLSVPGPRRWLGKVKLPRAPRPRTMLVLELPGQLVAMSARCPHEQADLSEGRLVSPFVIECPVHQNQYDLREGALRALQVVKEEERLFILWRHSQGAPVPAAFTEAAATADGPAEAGAPAGAATHAALEAELAALKEAASLRERQVLETLQQMDGMVSEVEGKRREAEAASRKLEEVHGFVNRVLDTMSEALIVVDPQGRVKEVNRRLETLLGEPRQALLGRELKAVVAAGQELTAQQGAEVEGHLTPRAGEPLEHLLRAAGLYGPSGKREGTVVVGTDIRRIKAAQREVASALEKVTNLLDSMRQGVFVVLESGTIVDPVSRFSGELFGRDIVGQHLFDVLYRDLDRRSEAFSLMELAFLTSFGAEDFQWVVMADHFPRRVVLKRGEDDTRVLRVEYCPLRDAAGLMDRLMVIVDDVTQIELLEAERRTHERQTVVLKELAQSEVPVLRQFFESAHGQLRACRTLLAGPPGPEMAQVFLRTLHTLKGNARMAHLSLVGAATHEAENLAAFLKEPELELGARSAAMEKLKDQLQVLQRQLDEYATVAEGYLHVPNDHQRQAAAELHRAATALDRQGATPPLAGALLEAATAVGDAEVSGAAGELVRALEAPRPGPELEAAQARALAEVAAHLAAARGFELYSLSRASWAALYRAAWLLTRDLRRCRACAGGSCRECGRSLERAMSAAGGVKADYLVALLGELPGLCEAGGPAAAEKVEAVLREVWRHLGFHSTLEMVATLRHHERETLHGALAAGRDVDQLFDRGIVRAGTVASFLDAMHQEGVSTREVLQELQALFGRASPAEVALAVCSARWLPELPPVLDALDPRGEPKDFQAWYAELGGGGALFVPAEARFPYLKRLDLLRLVRTIREFVAGNFRLLFDQVQTVEVMVPHLARLQQAVAALDAQGGDAARQVRAALGELLHAPVLPALSRQHEMVADLGRRMGKKVDFRLTGDATLGVPREHLHRLQDALVHLVRNAVDHGLETPPERAEAGKPATGTLEVFCGQEREGLVVRVRDDGRGIDPAKVKAKALAMGLIDTATAAGLDDAGAVNLIFLPHFSTARDVTDVSGRGIGMDVVRTSLEEIGAVCRVSSQVGRGSEFTLVLQPPAHPPMET